MNFLKALKDSGSDKKAALRQLTTVWGENLDAAAPLPEYPRPQLVRDNWQNLNGPWQCAFTPDGIPPREFELTITVPFSPEAALSGVGRQLQPGEYLWYRRSLMVEALPAEKRCLLHFGAVDQCAMVLVNGQQAATHEGGYLPFTVDITPWLHKGENELTVRVLDDSDRCQRAYGKQKLKRGGMFYTAQSGIWQTVWLEWVPQYAIDRLKITPDETGVTVQLESNAPAGTPVQMTVFAGDVRVASTVGTSDGVLRVKLEQPHLWAPEDPFLYTATVRLGDGESADEIQTYFALRTLSIEPNEAGQPVFCLNHKPLFLHGVLDQGYWPDGLYTAPSDEALVYDIQTIKGHGFNMLRKHIKIEPDRWYYHCDRLGMLVWQDMVSGGGYNFLLMTGLPTVLPGAHIPDSWYPLFGRSDKRQRAAWEGECAETVRHLYNHPCIAVWVPFNEGWGQFDSRRITAAIKQLDPTRPVDATSGWFDHGAGDFLSKHIYFRPLHTAKRKNGDKRAWVISEYGGYAHSVSGHTSLDHSFGYSHHDTTASLNAACKDLMQTQLQPLLAQGLAGAVYTQVSDVEEEVNGILTYDRRVDKFDRETFQIK